MSNTSPHPAMGRCLYEGYSVKLDPAPSTVELIGFLTLCAIRMY